MRIDHYSFGKIIIERRIYTSDVLIFPDRVISPWWRKEGHSLHMEDLEEVLREKPEVLVIGSGYSRAMEVPEDLVKELAIEGIRVVVKGTPEAVGIYNILNVPRKTAALHLTC
ncbi:MAG TPA: MTH938/NDUFAF3 family protein [Dissulfurispiraceae bacterium]